MANLLSPGMEEPTPIRVSEEQIEGSNPCVGGESESEKKVDTQSELLCRYAECPQDWESFTTFVVLIEDRAIALAKSVCREVRLPSERAEDFFRAALLKLIEKRALIDPTRNPKNWFLSIMCNGIREAARRPRLEWLTPFRALNNDSSEASAVPEPAMPFEEQPDRMALWNETDELLAQVVSKLKPVHQEAWRMRMQMLSIEEMAAFWGVPVNTARSRERRARMEICKLLERYYPELRRFWDAKRTRKIL